MGKRAAASYYDQREAGRLLGAYRLLEAVIGEDEPQAAGRSRDRHGRGARTERRAQRAERAPAVLELVGR